MGMYLSWEGEGLAEDCLSLTPLPGEAALHKGLHTDFHQLNSWWRSNTGSIGLAGALLIVQEKISTYPEESHSQPAGSVSYSAGQVAGLCQH